MKNLLGFNFNFVCWCSVRRGDVLSAWSGIRPLVTNPNSKDTQSLARNHIIEISDNRLVTIAGARLCGHSAQASRTTTQINGKQRPEFDRYATTYSCYLFRFWFWFYYHEQPNLIIQFIRDVTRVSVCASFPGPSSTPRGQS